jgi:hypothetical protein
MGFIRVFFKQRIFFSPKYGQNQLIRQRLTGEETISAPETGRFFGGFRNHPGRRQTIGGRQTTKILDLNHRVWLDGGIG